MTAAPQDPASTQLARALQLYDLGRPGDAETVAAQMLEVDPENPLAWCALARAVMPTDPERARDAARSALTLNPEEEWGYRLLSMSATRLADPSAAIDAARAAIRLAPFNPAGHQLLASALIREGGRDTEAEAAARRALELDPASLTRFLTSATSRSTRNAGRMHEPTTAGR